ncbi:MAG: signal peptidase II [Deltaproteobacteria bacterium]|nr:signal peptidase II [Deltaproteobacteria bacterium]
MAPPKPSSPASPASHAPASHAARGLRLCIALLALGMVGCDHATKIAAEAKLSGAQALPIVSGILELRYTRNDDTAFSLLHTFGLQRSPGLLLAMASLALVAIAVMWVASRKKASKVQHVAFALVIAGALGNVLDRALRGYVVDFIHLSRWPVFNVADIAVVAGMLLLFASGLKSKAPTPPAPLPPDPPAPG